MIVDSKLFTKLAGHGFFKNLVFQKNGNEALIQISNQ